MAGMVAVDVALSLDEMGKGTTKEIAEYAGCSVDAARYALDWMEWRGIVECERGAEGFAWRRTNRPLGILDDDHMRVLSRMYSDLNPSEWAQRWDTTPSAIIAAKVWIDSCVGVEW